MVERVQKAIAEYCRTHTYREAQIRFGCDIADVLDACALFEVPVKNKSAIFREQMAGWARENEATVDEVAAHFSCSTVRAKKALNEHGIPLRKAPKGPSVKDRTLRILAELMRGDNPNDVANKWAVSKQYVFQLRDRAVKAGIPIEMEQKKGGA